MLDHELRATLLGNGFYGRNAAPYTVLEVSGPDAAEVLQRLCTQDVQNLAEGVVVPAAFLDAKGKLQVTSLVLRRGDTFWLETHSEQAARLQELLERYHFTEKLSIRSHESGAVHEVVTAGGAHDFVGRCSFSEEVAGPTLCIERRGVTFTRSHGGVVAIGAIAEGSAAGAAPDEEVPPQPMSDELAEAARMLAGFVRVGLETEASTLALEANLDDHCSTTKGCYTGQEIVARIHTYGHVNRKLCLLRLPSGDAITTPVALHECEDDIPVGRVMHAVSLAEQEMRLGLGYLPKDFQVIGTKLTLAGAGDVEVIGFEEAPDEKAPDDSPPVDKPPSE